MYKTNNGVGLLPSCLAYSFPEGCVLPLMKTGRLSQDGVSAWSSRTFHAFSISFPSKASHTKGRTGKLELSCKFDLKVFINRLCLVISIQFRLCMKSSNEGQCLITTWYHSSALTKKPQKAGLTECLKLYFKKKKSTAVLLWSIVTLGFFFVGPDNEQPKADKTRRQLNHLQVIVHDK